MVFHTPSFPTTAIRSSIMTSSMDVGLVTGQIMKTQFAFRTLSASEKEIIMRPLTTLDKYRERAREIAAWDIVPSSRITAGCSRSLSGVCERGSPLSLPQGRCRIVKDGIMSQSPHQRVVQRGRICASSRTCSSSLRMFASSYIPPRARTSPTTGIACTFGTMPISRFRNLRLAWSVKSNSAIRRATSTRGLSLNRSGKRIECETWRLCKRSMSSDDYWFVTS
jgi:hypothetical protein